MENKKEYIICYLPSRRNSYFSILNTTGSNNIYSNNYLCLIWMINISFYIQPNDPNLKGSQALTKLLPLMIGYFALSVPSGLSLYWLVSLLFCC